MPPKPKAKKSVQKTTVTGPPTTRQKRKASGAFISAAKEKRAQGKGKGETAADRAQSGRAAAFAQEKARCKPTKPVVEDDVAAAEPAADKAAMSDDKAAMFSDDDDDDDDTGVVDQPDPEPFTPSKCAGELFVTPSKCHIIATLRVSDMPILCARYRKKKHRHRRQNGRRRERNGHCESRRGCHQQGMRHLLEVRRLDGVFKAPAGVAQ
jgi:hypothetical protein